METTDPQLQQKVAPHTIYIHNFVEKGFLSFSFRTRSVLVLYGQYRLVKTRGGSIKVDKSSIKDKRKIGEVHQDFLIGKFRNFSSPSTFDIILKFLEFRFV